MGRRGTSTTRTDQPGKNAPPSQRRKVTRGKKLTKADFVELLLQNMQHKLHSDDSRATIGDFIRLLQLQKEIEEEQPKEITVRWVEPTDGSGDSET